MNELTETRCESCGWPNDRPGKRTCTQCARPPWVPDMLEVDLAESLDVRQEDMQ